MKVLLFTLEYPPFRGGVANVYENIVKHWPSFAEATDGKPSSVKIIDDKLFNIFVLHNNDNKLISNRLLFLKWLPSIWQLRKVIKKKKIDHVLVGHILPLGTAAYIVSKFIKIPYSIILHGMDFTYAIKTKRKKWIAKKVLDNAQNIICMNSYTADLVREVVGADIAKRVEVVNPGIDIQGTGNREQGTGLKNKYNLKNKIVLLSVGRLVKRKGFDKVLESLLDVLKEVPDLVYVIAGAGPELSDLRFKIKDLKLETNVHLITDMDDDERNAWYNLCDIFIMPSRKIGDDFEGFGVVFLEANLFGKPVIAGDSGGVCDAVKDGVSGLLVNPENLDEITGAIIKLAKDKELREKLGVQGRERAVNKFNWEGQVNKIYNIINKKMTDINTSHDEKSNF